MAAPGLQRQSVAVDSVIDRIYRIREYERLNLQNLTYLVAVARERHFARAAVACGVSQPTLSAGIRRLEQEVGFSVVRRGRRYEGLTPEGERVHDWALQVLADLNGLTEEVTAIRTGPTGRLRLGAIPTSLPTVALLTRPFAARHPAVTVSIQSLSSRQIEQALHRFELELGLTYLDNEPLSGVRALPLYRERYLLVTRADGPFAGRREVGWAEAADEPLCLLTPDMQNRRIVNACFAEAGVVPRPTVETNSVSTLYGHVRDGRWSSVVAHAWLNLFPVPDGMVALPLTGSTTTKGIGLVWLDRDPEPLLARALVEVAEGAGLEAALD
jgi:DNA-binding transcriptional LysR family regulator